MHWPWYSHQAPISWLIARDVHDAHLHMNLSRWQEYSADDRLRLLGAIGSAVRNREMPPRRYTLMHPEARLTDQERRQIYQWTRTERNRLKKQSISPDF
jgi:heme-binding protein